MSEKTKPNYFGSTWYNEYKGEFTGYSLFLTGAELEEARKQLEEAKKLHQDVKNHRVKIIIKPGRDPKKPYSIIADARDEAMRMKNSQATSSSRPAPSDDLPF